MVRCIRTESDRLPLRRLAILLCLGCLVAAVAFGQEFPTPPPACCIHRCPGDTGIRVGDISLYDERVLQSMVDALAASLKGVQTIDATRVNSAVGSAQGQTATRSSLGASLSYIHTGAPADTTPLMATPAATDAQAATTPTLAFGARSILAEQVQLAYQLANLRLVLGGAPADRYVTGSGLPRARVLLGVPVSLDARHTCAAAYVTVTAQAVETTLTDSNIQSLWDNDGPRSAPLREGLFRGVKSAPSLDDLKRNEPRMLAILDSLPDDWWSPLSSPQALGRLRLISMTPDKTTYNRVICTNDAKALSLGAVIGTLTGVGLSGSSSRNQAYLVADADTLAVPYPSCDSSSLSFGWQVRPVLGRRVVEPGNQVFFAVLGLPDTVSEDLYVGADGATRYALRLTVTTEWCHLKADNIRGDPIAGSYKVATTRLNIVRGLETVDAAARPMVSETSVRRLGADQYEVVWKGAGLSGAQVIVGDTVLGASTGLTSLGDSMLRAVLPVSKLAKADPVVLGSSGLSVLGLDTVGTSAYTATSTVSSPPATAAIEAVGNSRYKLTVTLPAPSANVQPVECPLWRHETADPWFAIVGDKTVDLPGATLADAKLSFELDASLLASVDRLTLRQGLMGVRNGFEVSFTLTDRFSVDSLQAVHKLADKNWLLQLSGKHLADNIRLRVGENEYSPDASYERSPYCLYFLVPDSVLTAQDRALVWRQLDKRCFTAAVAITKEVKPVGTAATPAAAIEIATAVVQGQTKPVLVKGTRAGDVIRVEFGGSVLPRYGVTAQGSSGNPPIADGAKCSGTEGFLLGLSRALTEAGNDQGLVFTLEKEGKTETLLVTLTVTASSGSGTTGTKTSP